MVVKPAISAASLHTRRFQIDRDGDLDEGRRFLADLAAERDVMIQPYLPSVETEGERALIWIAGELTHAVRKSPRFSGEDEEVSEAVPTRPPSARWPKPPSPTCSTGSFRTCSTREST